MITHEDFSCRIRSVFPDAQVEVRDLMGEGDHFEAVVASSAFRGKSLVEQHRMVYDAIARDPEKPETDVFSKPCKGDRPKDVDFGKTLHALALKTKAL